MVTDSVLSSFRARARTPTQRASGSAGSPGKRAYEIFLRCYENGVLVRNAGDVLVFAPAFIAEETHIAQMVDTLGEAIRALA